MNLLNLSIIEKNNNNKNCDTYQIRLKNIYILLLNHIAKPNLKGSLTYSFCQCLILVKKCFYFIITILRGLFVNNCDFGEDQTIFNSGP